MEERVRIGILGCGHVGRALVRLIHDHADVIEARAGVPLEVGQRRGRRSHQGARPPAPGPLLHRRRRRGRGRPRRRHRGRGHRGHRAGARADRRGADGGQARRHRQQGAARQHGRELFETAEGAGVDLLFEASVGGGIPLIRPLRESLAGDRIRRVMGIVNGTTNYILTRMTDAGASFADALAEAQRLGFAERDPTADVEGFDAAAKAAIIASIAFGARVVAGDVYREGIAELTARRHRVGSRPRLRGEAARGRRRARRRGRGAGAPGDGPGAPPARIGPRLVQRGVHRGRRGRRADALRPRRRRRPDRVSRCSATSSTRRRTWSRDARARPSARWPASRSAPSTRSSPSSTCSIEVADRPGRARRDRRPSSAPARRVDPSMQQTRHRRGRPPHLRHPQGAGGGPARHGDRAARRRSRPPRRRGPPGHGRRRDEHGHADGSGWPGLIEAYRGAPAGHRRRRRWSPCSRATRRCSTRRAWLDRAGVARRAAQGRGLEPHRFVQGPGHDDGDHQGGRRARQGRGLRVDGQHVGVGGRVRGARRATVRGRDPRGPDRAGQARAGAHPRRARRAGPRQLRPGARRSCASSASVAGVEVVNSINPVRIEGQKTAAFEIVDVLGDAPTVHCIPVGNAGQHHRVLAGLLGVRSLGRAIARPRMLGWQAAGRGAARARRAGAAPRDARHRDPHRQPRVVGGRDRRPRRVRRSHRRGQRRRDPGRVPPARRRGRLLRGAGVGGVGRRVCCKAAAEGLLAPDDVVVCTVTGHGLKDPQRAIAEVQVGDAGRAPAVTVAGALDLS